MTAAPRSVLAVLGGYLTLAIVVMLFTEGFKMLFASWFPAEGMSCEFLPRCQYCVQFLRGSRGRLCRCVDCFAAALTACFHSRRIRAV